MSDFCGDCKHNAAQPDSRSCIRADWTDGCRCLGFERDPETPGVYEDRPVAASGRLLGSVPIPNGYATEMYDTPEKIRARRDRCSLCTAAATIHLPPELGASALCRACADRVRAALVPPDEAERKQLEVLHNLGCRASRVPPLPRCTCAECAR